MRARYLIAITNNNNNNNNNIIIIIIIIIICNNNDNNKTITVFAWHAAEVPVFLMFFGVVTVGQFSIFAVCWSNMK